MSDGFKIITNHQPRYTIDAYELTSVERAEFDYLDWESIDNGTDSATFFRYRGTLYDLGEFMRVEDGGELAAAGYHGFAADSFFSGVAIRFPGNDDESVIVALVLA